MHVRTKAGAIRGDKDKSGGMLAGANGSSTLSGMNLSHHEGTSSKNNCGVNSSFNEFGGKNNSKNNAISLNHYLSHNATKEYSEQSQIQDEFSGGCQNKSGLLLGAENLSQSCIDDMDSS